MSINKKIFKKVDYFIILGKSLNKNYDLLYNDNTKVVVIPNGYNINEDFSNIIFQDEHFNILFLSNLIESKGYIDLLEAIKILVNDHGITEIKCIFCGNFLDSTDNYYFRNKEDAELYFNNFIKINNLNNNIIYKGLVSGNDKHNILKKSDIFILPTYYSTEAQPLSILEALAYGKIVIATPHRAIPDMIIDHYNGLIIDFKSPKSIVEAFLKVYKNKDLQNKLSKNAVNFVKNNFSSMQFENNIINLFKELNVIN
jgi:glycosyltransferase involved in cell wall biosynthesis